jgi:putative membrane protein
MMWGYGPNWGMGPWGGWGGYGEGMIAMMIIGIVFLALVIAAVVWFVRATTQPGQLPMMSRRSAGLDALEERYARGEIKRDEYLEKKRDISR